MDELNKIELSTDSYLTKCRGIADLFSQGKITDKEGDIAALEMGLNPDDVAEVFTLIYKKEVSEMAIKKIEGETYLQKVASVVDLIASGEVSTEDEITMIAATYGLALVDIDNIYNLAYGNEEQDK